MSVTAPDEAPRPIDEVVDLLDVAARIARRVAEGRHPEDRLDSVAWRAADALLILREIVEQRWPGIEIAGLHRGTGRGAQLIGVELSVAWGPIRE